MTLPLAMASLLIRKATVSKPASAAVTMPKRSISWSKVPARSATKFISATLFAPPPMTDSARFDGPADPRR